MQQSHEDQPSLDQIEVLNAICKNEKELLLNILLKEILAVDIVIDIIIKKDTKLNNI